MSDFVCPSEYLAFAHRLADASGAVIRRYFRQAFAVEGKADRSPVTVADRETEQVLRTIIGAAYPAHGIQGEEFGVTNAGAEFLWVLDPIDGTRAFSCGKPVFGTLIALLRDGIPVLGVIDQPILCERWIGATGHTTQFNGKDSRTRACAALGQAVAILSPNNFLDKEDGYLTAFRRVNDVCGTTSVGWDCYVYGLLASGHCDVIIEGPIKLHDFAALVPVVEGAGGMMTDWQGRALDARSDGLVMAAGDKRVGQEALSVLRGAA